MNKKILLDILAIQSSTYNQWRMFAYIIRRLHEVDCSFFVDDGCVYATKGDVGCYPCIVAHMDTVHKVGPDLSLIEKNNKITGFDYINMRQTGIGGDDKVGIFIALELLKEFDNIKVAFFRDEEIGCEGSYGANMDWFADCGFVLQFDRKGNTDFITSASGIPLSGKAFQKDVKRIMKGYGYKFGHGLMTDVMALKEQGLSCACANIACGYYRPHSEDEYVDVNDVRMALDMGKDIIASMAGVYYQHTYTPKPMKKYDGLAVRNDLMWHGWKNSRLTRSSFFDDSRDKIRDPQYCDCCMEQSRHIQYVSEYNMDICEKCYNNYVKVI